MAGVNQAYGCAENAEMAHFRSRECQKSPFKKKIGPFWHSQHIHIRDISLRHQFLAILATRVMSNTYPFQGDLGIISLKR